MRIGIDVDTVLINLEKFQIENGHNAEDKKESIKDTVTAVLKKLHDQGHKIYTNAGELFFAEELPQINSEKLEEENRKAKIFVKK